MYEEIDKKLNKLFELTLQKREVDEEKFNALIDKIDLVISRLLKTTLNSSCKNSGEKDDR